ncbi:MAG: hypothetical protein V1664_03105 [Candidatus Uhrbacteria bacterium]
MQTLDFLFLSQLANPDYFIFLAFGAMLILSFLLSKLPDWRLPVFFLFFLFLSTLGKIVLSLYLPVIHFVPEKFAGLAVLFITHRWLILAPIPLLIFTALIILLVYKNKISDSHAKEYRRMVIFSVITSLILFSLSAIESVF